MLKKTIRGAVLCSAPVRSHTIKNIPTEANEKRPALPLSFFAENLLFNISDKARELFNVLIFHGDADNVVPVTNAHDIFSLAKAPKKLIIQKNAGHQMTSKKYRAQFEKESVAWFSRCFGQ